MEFEKPTFNPNDQGEIMTLESLLTETTKEEETIPLNLIEEEVEKKEEVVDTTPEKKEEATPKKEQPNSKVFDYKAYVQKKIQSGDWYEVEGLDEIEVDEDTFEEIQKAQVEKKVEEAKENTVKTDALSPMMLKALEIDKNGGNISQVFETYKNIYENPENPISQLDLDSPQDQERLLRYYHKSKGLEDFEVSSIVEGHKKNLTLNKASEKAKNEIDTVFNNYLEQQASQTENAKVQKQEALKAYRSNVSEAAKKYDLNDNYRKTIVDKVSKADENGTYAVDAMFDEWRRDPEKAIKIAMFMNNEEEYVKTRASKVINQEKEKIFTTIKLTNKGKGSGTVDFSSSSKNQDKDVINLSEL